MSRTILLAGTLLCGIALGAAPSRAAEVVHYQLKKWQAKHIHDAEKATKIAATLKKLGCEVEKHEHGNHIDVKYRCAKERQLPVKSHEEALKWEKWLKEYGFKAYHTHRRALSPLPEMD